MDKNFVNGIDSWIETHFEIVSAIALENRNNEPCKMVGDRYANQGHGSLYELAEELTNEFELRYKGTEWDGEFFDEIDNFIEEKFGRLL